MGFGPLLCYDKGIIFGVSGFDITKRLDMFVVENKMTSVVCCLVDVWNIYVLKYNALKTEYNP